MERVFEECASCALFGAGADFFVVKYTVDGNGILWRCFKKTL